MSDLMVRASFPTSTEHGLHIAETSQVGGVRDVLHRLNCDLMRCANLVCLPGGPRTCIQHLCQHCQSHDSPCASQVESAERLAKFYIDILMARCKEKGTVTKKDSWATNHLVHRPYHDLPMGVLVGALSSFSPPSLPPPPPSPHFATSGRLCSAV
jgi:hypothetical protein